MFGRYKMIREIGRGAMAVVYLAEDTALQRNVALKSLSAQYASDLGFRERFQREGRILARVRHESIVPIYDFGEEDNVPYIVMEHMPGGTLAERIERHQLTVDESLDVLRRVASGLDAAHAAGVIHRDLKPANILFDDRGRAFVGDFGVGRMDGASTGVTMPGTVIGTAQYMSPEQVNGAPPTVAADIYSFGALAYETLVGHAPFRGDNVWAIMRQHLEDEVRPPGSINPALSFADEPLLSAMAKDPAIRPERASSVTEALDEGYRQRNPLAPPPGTIASPRPEFEPAQDSRPTSIIEPPARRAGSRKTVIFAAVGAALVAGGIAVGLSLLLGGGDEETPPAVDGSETAAAGDSTTAAGESVTAVESPTDNGEPTATPTPRDIFGTVILSETFDDPAQSQIQPPSGFSGSGFFDAGHLVAQDASADDDAYVPIDIQTGAKNHGFAIDAFAPDGVLILTCRGDAQFDVRLRIRQKTQEFQTQVLDKQQPGFITLTDWKKDAAINADGPNRLAMICNGNTLESIANRRVLATDRIPGIEGDHISFGVDGGVQAIFDNVEIRTD